MNESKIPSYNDFYKVYKENLMNNYRTAEHYGVGESSVRRWLRKYKRDNKPIDLIEEQKEKFKVDGSKKLLEQITKEKAKTEIILEHLDDIINPINYEKPPLPKINVNRITSKVEKEAMCVDISDSQCGKKTVSYNIDVFGKRLETLTNSILRIASLERKTYSIDTLVINFLGDIVEGETIFPSQVFRIEADLIDQVFSIAIPKILGMIYLISHYFKNVVINCVKGNHGRASKFNSAKTNWDLVFYKSLQIGLKNVNNIKVNVTNDFYMITEIMGTKHLLVHGDQIKMVKKTPVYGIMDAALGWADSLSKPFDYIHFGHFHVPLFISSGKKRILVNGSFDTDCEFVLEQLKTTNKPAQWVYFVSEKRGITQLRLIDLDKDYRV